MSRNEQTNNAIVMIQSVGTMRKTIARGRWAGQRTIY